MPTLPLEDNYNDVLGKAQRGLKLSDADLQAKAGITAEELAAAQANTFNDAVARKLAAALNLRADAVVELGKQSWAPQEYAVDGLLSFNTAHGDMRVNSYLVYDLLTKVGLVFDTGGDSAELLKFARLRLVRVKMVFLTHIHPDHVAELTRICRNTGAKAYVSELEPIEGAETIAAGKEFSIGNFDVKALQTSGHAKGGLTYYLTGLKQPVAFCGDAIFAGSMGGGMYSYEEALRTTRENILSLPDNTLLCPGHGPMTTVAEQKLHNAFFP